MADDDRIDWHVPLKAPAVEVVDLLSESKLNDDLVTVEKRDDEGDALEDEVEDDGDSQWSMYEDVLEIEQDGGIIYGSEGACTIDETIAFRKRLRLVGEDRFLRETIEAGVTTAKRLCTAFDIRPPLFLEGAPDEAYYTVLSIGISRELSKRVKLPQYNTVEDAVLLLKRSRNIIVLTGAGISTSLGIPDFRSKGTGLYSQLEGLGLSDPHEVFDISLFREDPSIFYSVAQNILPPTNRFSPTHAFIKLLQDKGKLLTNFTQNIDNLEGHAGISPEKLIQCHGSFATASCIECKYKVKGEVIYKELKAGKVARCDRCIQALRQVKPGVKRKRSSNGPGSRKKRHDFGDSSDSEDDDLAVAGVMKPDITFFGEALPAAFQHRLVDHDRDIVDLVVVIGTSLKVAPVSEVVGVIPEHIPQIYISREPCAHVDFDIDLLGDCDTVVTELCQRAGWDLQHEMVDKNNSIDVQLNGGYDSRFSFKISKA